jgi:hypothetical protein
MKNSGIWEFGPAKIKSFIESLKKPLNFIKIKAVFFISDGC